MAKQAIIDHGLEFDESLVIETFSKVDEGRKVTKQLLNMAIPPDAIFSSSDFTALGAIEEIKESGLRIPEDISVIVIQIQIQIQGRFVKSPAR